MKASAASRIQALFPSQTLVEVHVQDGSGDPYEVFVGPVQALTAGHFDGVFREAGCFYNLTVIGIHENLVQAVDIHPSNIMRSEFLWLTAPAPPKLTLEDSTRVEICWEGLKFCGTAGPRGQSSSGVEYILEVAEGCEWKGGKSAHFVTDLTVETYRQLWRGRVPKPVGVFDLQPGMRYYARVAVEYLGNRHVSEALCFHTSACPPTAPLIPRAYISPPTNQIDPSADYPPNILLKWSNVKPNGSEVMHFQVQMQQVLLSAAAPQSEAFSPLLAKRLNHVKTEKKILRGGKWVSLPSPKAEAAAASEPRSAAPYFQDQTLIITRWTDIFCHLDKKVKLCPPPPGVIEWRFRVRARNALGWSNFSPELCLHNRSHPTLFSAEYPPEYVGEALRLCSYSPSSPTPIISDSFYPAQQLLSSASESLSPPPHQQQQQQQQQQQYKSHHHQPQHHQEYYDNNAGNVYADSLEYIETLGGTAGAAPGVGRRPRATSALPSTSHADRRESFSSETGAGGVSAGNSRVMDEHGLDTFSTDRSALSSRGRSAGARLASH